MAANIIHSLRAIVDSNGIPQSGALIYVYDAGTTTLRTISADQSLSPAAANPIVCTGGVCPLRYTASGSYKVVVTTSAGVALTAYDGDNIDTGVAVGSGDLPVADGGTGASTAANARTNLAAASSATVSSLATDVATLQSSLTGTDSTQLASGTTAQRDVSPAVGMVRENTTTTKYEGYISGGWDNFMLETANAASTGAVTAETAEATYIRPDRLKYSPRVAIAYAYVTNSGTPTLVDGFNVTSVVDNGAGDTTVNFTTAVSNANFSAVASSASAAFAAAVTARTTSSVRVITTNSAGSASDANFSVICFGDI